MLLSVSWDCWGGLSCSAQPSIHSTLLLLLMTIMDIDVMMAMVMVLMIVMGSISYLKGCANAMTTFVVIVGVVVAICINSMSWARSDNTASPILSQLWSRMPSNSVCISDCGGNSLFLGVLSKNAPLLLIFSIPTYIYIYISSYIHTHFYI